MDSNGNEKGNGDFTFINEKIISKRKKKVKRAIFATALTLILAVLFGMVGRLVFIVSEPFWNNVLGIEPTKTDDTERRQQISIASEAPALTLTEPAASQPAEETEITPDAKENGTTPTVTAAPTEEAEPEPTKTPEDAATPTPAPKPSGEEKDEPKPTQGGGRPIATPSIVEQRIEATLDDYMSMMAEVRKLASQVNASLLKITTVTEGVNWLEETIEITDSLTGVIVAENNVELLILASYDKVKSVDSIYVNFSTTVILEAELYDYDSDYNLAVLAVKLNRIPEQILTNCVVAKFGESNVIYTGMPIIALGSPNGYNGSMEYGYVTSKGSTVYVTDNMLELFNTDITDNEDSDGIIVNMRGQIIGIITHTLKENKNININTAIGITKLKPVIENLANASDRIYFGITGEDMPEDILKEKELENGIYVTEVVDGSPAEMAGVKKGDILTIMDEVPIVSMSEFYTMLANYKHGDSVGLLVRRMVKQELAELQLEAVLQRKSEE